nr:MAG TPA: hypothetical protein [Caudoviricetes sp.]
MATVKQQRRRVWIWQARKKNMNHDTTHIVAAAKKRLASAEARFEYAERLHAKAEREYTQAAEAYRAAVLAAQPEKHPPF